MLITRSLDILLGTVWVGPLVLESFLRDLGHHVSTTQLLNICQLHVLDANLPICHIPKALCETGGLFSKVNSSSCLR